jgi:hypothetical protein
MELAEIRFAADSPLEGWREMDSNHRYRIRNNPFGYPVRSRNSPSATKTGSFVPMSFSRTNARMPLRVSFLICTIVSAQKQASVVFP